MMDSCSISFQCPRSPVSSTNLSQEDQALEAPDGTSTVKRGTCGTGIIEVEEEVSSVSGVAHNDPNNEWRIANVASRREEMMQVLFWFILASFR